MGKNIQADPSKMRSAAGQLTTLSETYSGLAKQLMNNASTMGDAWQGEDNQAFVTQITGFTQELEAMAQKLKNASTTLEKQAINYEQRQDAIVSSVKTLTN